jgi:hypothetical protein
LKPTIIITNSPSIDEEDNNGGEKEDEMTQYADQLNTIKGIAGAILFFVIVILLILLKWYSLYAKDIKEGRENNAAYRVKLNEIAEQYKPKTPEYQEPTLRRNFPARNIPPLNTDAS